MNKKLSILVLTIIIAVIYCKAQDVIVKKDGSTIISKVLEIDDTNVKYKKYSNLKGPLYVIKKVEILSINYQNGEIEKFDDNVLPDYQRNNNKNPSSEVNQRVIQLINEPPSNYHYYKDNKKAEIVCAFMGVTSESLVSDDEVEIRFEDIVIPGKMGRREQYFNIVLYNKTNKILYVDRASCFYIDSYKNGCSFYSANETATSSGKNIGAGLGLGAIADVFNIGGIAGTLMNGVSLNGGMSKMSTTTYKEQQIVTIPPQGQVTVAEGCRIPLFHVDHHSVKMGELISYNYETSPVRWTYFITYSDRKDFTNYSNLCAIAYCKYVLGYIGDCSVGQPNGVEIIFKKSMGARTDFQVKKKETVYNKYAPF